MSTAKRGALAEPDLLVERALIDGEWVAGDRKPIEVDDPFTLAAFGEVPNLGAAEAERAVAAAAAAFPGWAGKTAHERGRVLRRWLELLVQHRDDLARLITRENGKTFREAQGEVDYGCAFIEFYAAMRRARSARRSLRLYPDGGSTPSANRSECARRSRRGTSRWQCSRARSARRSPRAARWSPSPPARPR
jgi:acyl-CoA reductase-like NAD-dependent aldehyde dehydrogenase